MDLPRYQYDIHGTTVSLKPYAVGGVQAHPEDIFYYISQALQVRVYMLARTLLPGLTETEIDQVVRGSLFLENLTNGHQTPRNGIKISQITSELCLNLFETQSGAHANLYAAEWTFWINPHSIQFGAGMYKKPKEINGLNGWDYKPREEDRDKVGCAAIALARNWFSNNELLASGKNKIIVRGKQYEPFFIRKCIEFQDIFEFADINNVSVDELGRKFIEKFPDHRLAFHVFRAHCNLYTGQDYVYEENEKKTWHIHYSLMHKHFVYVSAPATFASCHTKSKCGKFCWKCCTLWNPQVKDSKCRCGENSGIVHQTKRKQCMGCNEFYYRSHKCGASSCHECTAWEKSKDKGTFDDHRCVIQINPDTFMKKFIGEEVEPMEDNRSSATLETEKKKFKRINSNLWVWDIESNLVPIEDEETDVFEVDENGFFIKQEQGYKTCTIQKCKQVPNFVAWENVFTGEKHQSYNILEFIEFAMTENGGHNVFLAHNSAGYDTRLLFEALFEYGVKTDIKPITRGFLG